MNWRRQRGSIRRHPLRDGVVRQDIDTAIVAEADAAERQRLIDEQARLEEQIAQLQNQRDQPSATTLVTSGRTAIKARRAPAPRTAKRDRTAPRRGSERPPSRPVRRAEVTAVLASAHVTPAASMMATRCSVHATGLVPPSSSSTPRRPHSRMSIACASRSRSTNGSPLTSTRTRRRVPPVNGHGATPG